MTDYRSAGVDIAAATDAKQRMAAHVRSTHGPAVISAPGSFGGCFDLSEALSGLRRPVLVSSTDGVGTKTLIAEALGRYDTIGQDLVNHCINDILVQGARPLFFLDYLAAARLNPAQAADVVAGCAVACRAAAVALVGGETAEMPDVYNPGAIDLAGTIVGIVDREAMLPRADIVPGDVVLALVSSGLHTNGYSLARRIVRDHAGPLGYAACPPELGGTSLGEALLAVHCSYLSEVTALQQAVPIKALCHITGGGIYDNLPRVLPDGLGAQIQRGSWPVPPIFSWLVEQGGVAEREAYHALNMGLGMLIVIAAADLAAAQQALPAALPVGLITATPEIQLA
jgi:phosphoribosylformylglycinamidine cyclo-ligase